MNAHPVSPCVALVLCLVGCQQEKIREVDWAKAALARNPAYEIIATDEHAGVFTVRDTTSGEVSTLKLAELIATPRSARDATTPTPAPASAPVETPDAVEDTRDALASDQTTDDVLATPTGTGTPLAEGPGYRIERSDLGHAPTAEPAAANVERRSDPIICQGDRLMHIDGETIEFTGDAVIAEKGCDLYISNARIRAGGVGIIARQARVHIANSVISGVRASYEASEGAQIYVAQSTFTGVGRRFDGASMTDLGGNSYTTH